ncbi:MAG: peroxiredoxin [Rickettsiales bacterium]
MAVLVGKPAPDFTASAVMPDNSFNNTFKLSEYGKDKLTVLFFYPLDFTFVCPSEIIAFDTKVQEFKNRGAELIGVSVDSHFSHLAFKNTPTNKGGIGQVQFPLVADITKKIARDYDVLLNDSIAFRATFIIDQHGIVRHQLINDLPLGRNVEETLRTIDALKYHQEYGDVCPANWIQGEEAMKPTQEGVAKYLAKKYSNR